MGIKTTIKNVIGEQRVSKAKGNASFLANTAFIQLTRRKKMWCDSKYLEVYRIISDKKHHIFRGYYDIDHMNRDGNRILCHRMARQGGKTNAECEVGYYFLDTGKFVKISVTRAWCWQQGSRLRWIDDHRVIFNAADHDHYCAQIFDVRTNGKIGQIDHALYDVAADFSYGITLNFSRLQKMRPGYGYQVFPDPFESEKAPAEDGLFIVDLKSGDAKLLFSLEELAERTDPNGRCFHYLNHLSISPDGFHFIFFHIFREKKQIGWNCVLYVSDREGKNIRVLEERDRVSHYCWIDNVHLMATCRMSNGKEYYCIFNVITGKKKELNIEGLEKDGHPTLIPKSKVFVTDTYPLKLGYQQLALFREDKKNIKKVAFLYHDDRMRGEKRCDLHPTISKDGKWLSVDTTFQNGIRSVVVFSVVPGR